MVIGESKVRAIRSEYDGFPCISIERLEWRGSWERVATFRADTVKAVYEDARRAGWAWLVDQ